MGADWKGRDEDQRFLTGASAYVADIRAAGALHAVVLRSPHAHARIGTIKTDQASAVPGVHGVFTAADLSADGIGWLRAQVSVCARDGSAPPLTDRPILASSRVRYVGEAVAFVVANTREAAFLAAEAVDVAYDPAPAVSSIEAVVDLAGATPDGQPVEAFVWRKGAETDVRAALAASYHVVRANLRVSRVTAAPLETRGAVAYTASDGRLVVHASHQNPFQLRQELAAALDMAPADLRVILPDVGGSFGMKGGAYPEYVLVAWAARRLGAPVRWIADRVEAFLSDCHGRDIVAEAELGLDRDGLFTALHVHYDMNVGAYLSPLALPALTNLGGVAGVYRTPLISADATGYFTNTVPLAPYRGAGRPEASYTIERLIDIAARQIGISPFDLRERNLIRPEQMPWQTGFTFKYDCGDFPRVMKAAAELSDVAGFERRRVAAATRGRLRGIGIVNPIEVAGGPYGASRPDAARISIDARGGIVLKSGMMSTGQGLERAFPSLLAERLGVKPGIITYRQGDTDLMGVGHGQGGSSGLSVGGTAVVRAAHSFIESGMQLAAEMLEAAAVDLVFADGMYRVEGTDLSLSMQDLVAAAAAQDEQHRPHGEFEFRPDAVNFPNGCHVCEVEIDPETGQTEVIDYWAVEDVGQVLNPVLVRAQLQGGIAQGLGQATAEAIVYDADGQLITASLADYAMPRASDMPRIEDATICIPTFTNALGTKGVGEAGTVGSLAAIMNAVCDALAPLGVRHLDMPATAARVFDVIRAARPGAARPMDQAGG